MKTKITTLLIITAMAMMVVLFQSCGTDSGPEDLNIESMTVGGMDLNSAQSPEDVPSDATIEVTFSSNVKAATATSANITLVQDYNDEQIPLDISVSGATITITPQDNLGSGALYQLTLTSGLLNEDDQPLANTTRSFTTAGTFSPPGIVAHWTFENSPNDVANKSFVGKYDASAEVDITYNDSRNADAGKAATFNGNTSIIEYENVGDLVETDAFTLSFWVKTDSQGHVNGNGDPAGHFVMGMGAFFGFQFEIDAGYNWLKIPNWIELSNGEDRGAGDLFWNGDGKTRNNDGWQGTTFNDEEDIPGLAKDQWMHVTFVFDGPNKTRSMYVNGELRIKHDFSLWPEDATERLVTGMTFGGAEPEVYPDLAFGFLQSRRGNLWDGEPWGGYDFPTANHFKGQLDDVKIYHKALTETEIQLMYDSES